MGFCKKEENLSDITPKKYDDKKVFQPLVGEETALQYLDCSAVVYRFSRSFY